MVTLRRSGSWASVRTRTDSSDRTRAATRWARRDSFFIWRVNREPVGAGLGCRRPADGVSYCRVSFVGGRTVPARGRPQGPPLRGAEMDTEILQLSGVSKRFGATAALSSVDLEVRAGEVHALIGENGAGKSTLLNILAGAFPPDAGTMRLDGRAFAPRNEADARRRGVAHIHQELSLCPHLSIAENVLLGAEPARGGRVDFEAMESRDRKSTRLNSSH